MKLRNYIHLPTLIIISIIWCILQVSLKINVIIEAIFLGTIVSIIQQYSYGDLFKKNEKEKLTFNLFIIIKYLIVLWFEIYKSSFKVILHIIKGKEDVKVIKIPTNLKNQWHRVIIGTSITLTPGTITLTEQKKILWVLSLSLNSETIEDMAHEIKGHFEEILLEDKGEKND